MRWKGEEKNVSAARRNNNCATAKETPRSGFGCVETSRPAFVLVTIASMPPKKVEKKRRNKRKVRTEDSEYPLGARAHGSGLTSSSFFSFVFR